MMRAGADAWKERSTADAAGRTALLRALANSDIADNEKIALGTGLIWASSQTGQIDLVKSAV